MKQHISSDQLKELNFKQVNYLGKYLKVISYPETEEEWERNKTKKHLTMYLTLLEKINIGNMIQLLSRSDFGFPHIGLTESAKRSEYIVVGVTSLSGSKKLYTKTYEADELCDALWETLKTLI